MHDDDEWVDVCGVCEHARDEQAPADLGELLERWWRRLWGRHPAPAMCGSTVRIHDRDQGLPTCRCRDPFHGS